MAAENAAYRAGLRPAARRFNEAAANGRGKLSLRDLGRGGGGASMRPRRMAAENPRIHICTRASVPASMRPRRMAAENGGRSRCDGVWTTKLQ